VSHGAQSFAADVAVVGGCGRVGLPLAIAFASRSRRVRIYDTNAESVRCVGSGAMPFHEEGADPLLRAALAEGRLAVSSQPDAVAGAEAVVVVIGTPVDEHLNPDPTAVRRVIDDCAPYLRDGQLLALRSTVYPGVTASVERTLAERGVAVDVAFCPERIAEGRAMTELFELPQIVGARTAAARERAAALFAVLTPTIVHLEPEEAELAKLFTNAWRYIKFATANQFFVMANDHGLDFERIRAALAHDYPRAADMPGAGFAAGPCLLKDTMQLAAFTDNGFVLGHAAMLVNEGLPLYLVSRLEERFDLAASAVGILGMAYKRGSDDTRQSLAYKLRRILRFRAREVLCTDHEVRTDPTLLPLEEVLERSDLLVIAAPHEDYRSFRTEKPVVDIWNLRGDGVRV
jgi:UDP-N-acetyl-D-mannosaminuronic acid dehydrogenase